MPILRSPDLAVAAPECRANVSAGAGSRRIPQCPPRLRGTTTRPLRAEPPLNLPSWRSQRASGHNAERQSPARSSTASTPTGCIDRPAEDGAATQPRGGSSLGHQGGSSTRVQQSSARQTSPNSTGAGHSDPRLRQVAVRRSSRPSQRFERRAASRRGAPRAKTEGGLLPLLQAVARSRRSRPRRRALAQRGRPGLGSRTPPPVRRDHAMRGTAVERQKRRKVPGAQQVCKGPTRPLSIPPSSVISALIRRNRTEDAELSSEPMRCPERRRGGSPFSLGTARVDDAEWAAMGSSDAQVPWAELGASIGRSLNPA